MHGYIARFIEKDLRQALNRSWIWQPMKEMLFSPHWHEAEH